MAETGKEEMRKGRLSAIKGERYLEKSSDLCGWSARTWRMAVAWYLQ